MKNSILFGCLFFISASTFGQRMDRINTTKFAIGGALGFATSNPLKAQVGNKGWSLGAGGVIQLEHFFQENLSGIAEAGIISFAGRSSGPNTKNKAYTTVPVRFGANGYIGNLHLGAQVGAGFNKRNGESVTAFAYSPQIGYNFTRNNAPLDFTVSYDGYAGHGGFSAFVMRLSLIL